MTIAATRSIERSRPATVTAAVLLTVITQIGSIPFYFAPGADVIPKAVIGFGIVAGVLALLGAWGMWNLRRWGAILTFVLTLLNVVSSIPGYFDPPSGWILFELLTLGPMAVAVLVLIALPSSRRAFRA